MSKVYIGIGSNLGDRQLNIDKALEKLKTRKNIQLDVASPIIETEPVGVIKQPKFLNTCCRIDTTLYPDELLSALKSIEREMGRGRNSAPKKLSVEEQLKALDGGGNSQAVPGGKRGPVNNPEDEDKNEPRVIDLDILLYDDIIMKGNNLIIPHRFLHERIFVLEPLSQIAPDIIHPVFKKSINDLLLECRACNSFKGERQKLLVKEFNDNIRVPVLAHSQPSGPKTLLTLICQLLKISNPKSSKTGTRNETR